MIGSPVKRGGTKTSDRKNSVVKLNRERGPSFFRAEFRVGIIRVLNAVKYRI